MGGKQGRDNFGIFVKGVIPGGLAARDGKLKPGDQLVTVNGVNFNGISNERATELLRQCASTNHVNIVVARDREAQLSFKRLSMTQSPPVTTSSGSPIASASTAAAPKRPAPPAVHGKHDRMSVDPEQRFPLKKLLWALKYIGYNITEQQTAEFYDALDVDNNGKVAYSDFEHVAQKKLKLKLEMSQIQLGLMAALTRRLSQEGPIPDSNLSPSSSIISSLVDEPVPSKIPQVKSDIQELQHILVQAKVENEELQSQVTRHQKEDLAKELAVKDCELRKAKARERRYTVAVEHLTQYVQSCHEKLSGNRYRSVGGGEPVMRGDSVIGNPRPPQYLSERHNVTSASLAKEAKDVLSTVRGILGAEELPEGWEEQDTDDGRKYYVNHSTQKTTWNWKQPEKYI